MTRVLAFEAYVAVWEDGGLGIGLDVLKPEISAGFATLCTETLKRQKIVILATEP